MKTSANINVVVIATMVGIILLIVSCKDDVSQILHLANNQAFVLRANEDFLVGMHRWSDKDLSISIDGVKGSDNCSIRILPNGWKTTHMTSCEDGDIVLIYDVNGDGYADYKIVDSANSASNRVFRINFSEELLNGDERKDMTEDIKYRNR